MDALHRKNCLGKKWVLLYRSFLEKDIIQAFFDISKKLIAKKSVKQIIQNLNNLSTTTNFFS